VHRRSGQIRDQADQEVEAHGQDGAGDQRLPDPVAPRNPRAEHQADRRDRQRRGAGAGRVANRRGADGVEPRRKTRRGQQADGGQQKQRDQQGGAGANGLPVPHQHGADQRRSEHEGDSIGGQQRQDGAGQAERRGPNQVAPRRRCLLEHGDGGAAEESQQQEKCRQRPQGQMQVQAWRSGGHIQRRPRGPREQQQRHAQQRAKPAQARGQGQAGGQRHNGSQGAQQQQGRHIRSQQEQDQVAHRPEASIGCGIRETVSTMVNARAPFASRLWLFDDGKCGRIAESA
jgi:hypothetical protein